MTIFLVHPHLSEAPTIASAMAPKARAAVRCRAVEHDAANREDAGSVCLAPDGSWWIQGERIKIPRYYYRELDLNKCTARSILRSFARLSGGTHGGYNFR